MRARLRADAQKGGDVTHVYRWRNNPRRAQLYGQRCRIMASGRMGSVLIEFQNAERVVTSRRALRRVG